MILLLVGFQARKGQGEAFAAALREKQVHEKTMQEPGCMKYDFFRSEDDPDLILLVENWESEEALETHMKGENLQLMRALEKEFVVDVKAEKYKV